VEEYGELHGGRKEEILGAMRSASCVCCTRPGMMVIKRENAGAEGAGDGIFMQADESSSGARLSAIAEDMEVLSGNGQHRRADGHYGCAGCWLYYV
jgi:hypothetical protein